MSPTTSFFLLSLAAMVLSGESTTSATHHNSFSVVGLSIRTSNSKEAADSQIGKQWQKFFREGVLQKIPNKLDHNIYAVYSDYASDKNGEYTWTVGAKVSDDSPVPEGMVLKKVMAGDYAVVTSDKGFVAKVVGEAWLRVWTMEDKHALPPRAYKTDFELYDQRAADPQSSQVDLYIGVKELK